MQHIKNIITSFLVAALAVVPLAAIATSSFQGALPAVVIAPLAASPAAGTYDIPQSVALSASGALSIHYALDGNSISCEEGSVYSNPISITQSTTITAISCYDNGYVSSAVSFRYTLPPSATPSGGGGDQGQSPSVDTGTNTPAPTQSTPPPAPIAAQLTKKSSDVNNDNNIDEYDLAVMMADWGKAGSLDADINQDKVVDEYDFSLLMLNWGK